jgi:serine/threonine-protein kinase HipA
VRFAPLYDIASALPYDDRYLPKLKMAMRIGGEYVIRKIEGRHWRRLAEAVGFDPDRTVQRVAEIATHIADAFTAVVYSEPVKALRSPLPERLLDRVKDQARACRDALARG